MHRKIVKGNTSTTDGKIDYKENKGNQQWIIQRNRQYWLHNTQGEDEHKNTKTKHRQN